MLGCFSLKSEVAAMVFGPSIDGHPMAEFRAWIKNCDAIVITAIYSGRAPKPATQFEPAPAAVARIAPAASRFQLMQLGICLLTEHEDSYVAQPFTIDVFPAVMVYRRDLLSKTLFDCDADHMKALSDANFDFNRVLRSGLNWFSPKDEAYILGRMKRKRAAEEASINDSRSSLKITDPKDKVFLDIAEVVLNKFCETGGDAAATIAAGQVLLDKIPVSDNLFTISAANESRIVLTPGNSFLRRLLHQMIGERNELISQRVPSADIRKPALAVSISATRDADRSLVPSEVLRRKIIKELDDADSAAITEMHEQVGFRYVIEEIVKAGKPILADDLLELLLHFDYIFTGEIGNSYSKIKVSLVNHWAASSLYDTTSHPGTFTNPIKLSSGFEKYSLLPKTLEAGAVALRRANEINLEVLAQPCCSIAIPGTISELCLEQDFDTFAIDISNLVVIILAGHSALEFEELVNRDTDIIKHQDSKIAVVEPKVKTASFISEINSRLKQKAAIAFSDYVVELEKSIIPSKQNSRRTQ